MSSEAVQELLGQAKIALQSGDGNTALALLSRAQNPSDPAPELNYLLGIALAKLNRVDMAIQALRQELTVQPDHTGARDLLRALSQARYAHLADLFELKVRGGLPHFFEKVRAGRKVGICYVGGSVTVQRGWRERSFDWIKQQYPGAGFEHIHAARGGENMVLASYKWDDCVLVHDFDLIMIEYAINGANGEVSIFAAIEEMIRKTWGKNKTIDILFVHVVNRQILEYAAGYEKCSCEVTSIEKVADYYALPSINMAKEIAEQFNADKIVFDQEHYRTLKQHFGAELKLQKRRVFTHDGLHPVYGSGDLLYLEVFSRSFPKLETGYPPATHTIPEPLIRQSPEHTFNSLFLGFTDDILVVEGLSGLTGAFPDLSKKNKLRKFHCQYNRLSGSLPSLDDNPDLESFDCSANKLTGAIPSLAKNRKLSNFRCDRNHFSGPLPDLSFNCELREFACIGNRLNGAIPALSNCRDLRNFEACRNQLSGCIPSLRNLTRLEAFYAHYNQLAGTIPDLTGNPALRIFLCHNNRLTGSIPSLENNRELFRFECNNNSLDGGIPPLSGLEKLAIFHCHNNRLCGRLPELAEAPELAVFNCSDNRLSGSIPELRLNLKLNEFRCSNNGLTGEIPDLSKNEGLTVFDCSRNNLCGHIPCLGNCPLLCEFRCADNLLAGPVPNLAGTTLHVFDCSSNRLEEYVSGGFDLPSLNYVDISFNHFMPESLQQMVSDLTASHYAHQRKSGVFKMHGYSGLPDEFYERLRLLEAQGWRIETDD